MKEILRPARPAKIIYGCDFCGRVNVWKSTMERHEKACYYNPDRECPVCDGSGRLVEWAEEGFKLVDDECNPCAIWKSIHEAEDAWALHQQERQEMAREN